MPTRKELKDLEKSLEHKIRHQREAEVILAPDDFKDGKLTFIGFHHLKRECEYIPRNEELEIKAPAETIPGLKNSLEFMTAQELYRTKRERRDSNITALIFLAAGALCMFFGYAMEEYIKTSVPLVREIVIIASWVFVWAAVEKRFFERKDLRDKRLMLLQIAVAKITPLKKVT